MAFYLWCVGQCRAIRRCRPIGYSVAKISTGPLRSCCQMVSARLVVQGQVRYWQSILRQFYALFFGDHPANDNAADDVKDDAAIKARFCHRSHQFRNIPAPHRRPGACTCGSLCR